MKWTIQPDPPQSFLDEHPELPHTVARLLWNRNLRTQEQIDEFLNPDYSQDLHDPFLFKDMEKAVAIALRALGEDKKIVVHGDYDADGITASAILIKTLRKLGGKNLDVFIPHREIDGYGLNMNTVDLLHKNNTGLIITCDCGISNINEVKRCKELGMEIIVTDHHAYQAELPAADAIIHPKVPGENYPDKGLAGGGVAFKLAQGLLKKHKEQNEFLSDQQTHEGFEKWMLDLVAIATIGDMVPLVGESRTLTRYGLTVLNKTQNIGLRQLLIVAGLADSNGHPKRGEYDAYTIGFQIAPRINAAGRMNHANTSYALLVTEDEKEAERLALEINQNNSDRQRLTEQLTTEARQQITETEQTKNPILFAYGEGWPTSILGLISGKLKEEFYRPAIAMGKSIGNINGSGRSIREFNLIAALQTMPEFFEKFGGHPQACGLSLKSPDLLEEFKKAITEKAQTALGGMDLTPQIQIDAEINLEDVDWKLYDLLQKFEPFGQANVEPTYVAYGLTVMSVDPMGQNGKHLRLMVKHNSHIVRKTIGFGLGDPIRHPDDWKTNLSPGDKIDMVFSIGVNEWNGNRELELSIKDIKKSAPR